MSTPRSASPAAVGMPPVLAVSRVSKRFGSTQAVRGVSFDVQSGEVHALLGHNGSGKSTLVKIISGLVKTDSGSFTVGSSTGEQARVGIVHQDLALCGDATVLENCCMGGYTAGRSPFLNWSVERKALEPVLESLAVDFSPHTMVRDLSPANQAIVAIARALKGPPGGAALNLLVLDEATARLRGKDADKVLATARLVARQGGGVLLVTHHMSEVLDAADRATVLSNGGVVGTVDVSTTDESALLEMVSGRQLANLRESVHAPARDGIATLAVDGLDGETVNAVSFSAYPGEILGLTGATGAGFEELPYLIASPDTSRGGSVTLDGKRLRGRSVADTRRRGVGIVPADRLTQGLHTGASARENLSPLVRRMNTSGGLVANRRERSWAARICARFQVKLAGPEVAMSALSGGNQQKVLLARVLEDKPRLLILHEPTQGVDEGTRRALIEVVRATADAGTAVLYVSSDIDEVAGCSDRVLVLREGTVVRETTGGLNQIDEIYAASYLSGPQDSAAATPIRGARTPE
jgi:ribose transport system ATP-binding protein